MPTLDLSGSPLPAVDLPRPLILVSPDVHERLVKLMAAVVHQARPEELATYLSEGFPEWVGNALDAPHERREMDDLVGLLLSVMQTPAA